MWQQQRELNDHLALIRILDDPCSKEDIGLFAVDPPLRTGRQRRQVMFDFLASCLAENKNNSVTIATTVYARPEPNGTRLRNQITLHMAGVSDRRRVIDFLSTLKTAWQIPNQHQQQERVLVHTMRLTERKLRKQLEKLRKTALEIANFRQAIDAWGKQEPSPLIQRWGTESTSASLAACFDELKTFAKTHNFDAPHLLNDPGARIHAYRQWFPHIIALASTVYLEEVDIGVYALAPDVANQLRRLRRRCLKLRWYEIGVNLLCTLGRDSIWRVLGPESYVDFLYNSDCESEYVSFRINVVEPPQSPAPMPRYYYTAQDAVQSILASINSGESDEDDNEPYACDITNHPHATTDWTITCTPHYHSELQLVEHLRQRDLRPSPLYLGGSRLTCRACKWYVDQLVVNKVLLRTGGLDTMYLEVPNEWLIPPFEAGALCTVLIREEAARLVLREEHVQRKAWEKEYGAEDQSLEVTDSFLRSAICQSHAYNRRRLTR